MFVLMDDEEKVLYGLFLNSGLRDAEMQNTEYRSRGERSGSRARARRNPPRTDSFQFRVKLVWKIKDWVMVTPSL